MVKKILLILLTGVVFWGCNDKSQEKTLFDEVIKMHDKIMIDEGQMMQSKMELKSLGASNPSPMVKDSVTRYSKILDDADNTMMDWMNKFNPDLSAKSHDQIMDYLTQQKKQIESIDSEINKSIAESNQYISKNKSK